MAGAGTLLKAYWRPSAVAEPRAVTSREPALRAFPNPFRSSTVLHWTPGPLDPSTPVLRVFDASGRLVRSFSSLLSPPSSLVWDGRDDMGHMLPAGAYFLSAGRAQLRLVKLD
jgi:hypothetical protein